MNPKSKKIFTEANENIEKYTKLICFVSIQISHPGLILPNFIISYYNYFTTDLEGGEAFTLAFPEWYVLFQNF